jgi:hypothetical protein
MQPEFQIGDAVIVLSPNLALWPPYEAQVMDRRYVEKSGWRYEVVEDDPDVTAVWVAEDDLRPVAEPVAV